MNRSILRSAFGQGAFLRLALLRSALVRSAFLRSVPLQVAFLLVASGSTLAAEPSVLKSPSGTVEVSLALADDGAPTWSVSYRGKPVVAGSRLGLTLRQTGPLSGGFRLLDVKRASRDEAYTLVAGKTREARDRSEEMTVSLERPGDRSVRLDVVFRAFDDGAAFRYVLPKQARLDRVDVVSEDTRFRFPADHKAWVLDLGSFTTSNEREFVPMPLLGIKPESIVGPPLTIEGDGFVACLAEANLRRWSGLHFARVEGGNDSRNPTLFTKLAPLPSRPDVVVRGALPMESPWRVLMLGAKPGDLVESTILTSLADPNEIGDTSWVKPGKVAWDWWNGPDPGPSIPGATFKVGVNTESYRHFIDFAAEFGLEYVLVDAGWYGDWRDGGESITRSIPEMDVPGLVAYARERNVRLQVWLNWQCVRDQMDAAFPLYEKWGIAGVKIDYMDRKDQEIVGFYQRAARTAAKHHLLVDFHGAYASSGEERTFPNWLTREGVMGLEYLKWSDRVTPRHNVTLPFTRMLLGPMDYTPGGFRNVTAAEFSPRMELPLVMTTRAHQLAMYVVYDSPLQMLSDTPSAYRGEPGADFLKVVPATWDETRVLDGKIGEYVVIARRRGNDWFVGAMTDAARKVAIPLGFLGGRTYDVTIWADTRDTTTNPTRLSVLPARLEGKGSRPLELTLAAGGGAALHLRPLGGGKR
jgi:alpha-glucosidase